MAMTLRLGRSRVAVVVLLGALAGCGSGGGVVIGPVLSETPPSPAGTPTAPSTDPATAPAGPAPPSPLQRRDLPPTGIPGTVTSYRADPGAGCPAVAGAPSVRLGSSDGPSVDGAAVGFGELFQLCVQGFAAGTDVAVAITGPDGAVDRRSLCRCAHDAGWETFWGSFPGDPLGSYGVRAEQGALRWTGTFRLVPQHRRVLRVVDGGPKQVVNHPGDAVRVVFAGFPPDTDVGLDLYAEDHGGVFLGQLPVHTDGAGVALATVHTVASDDTGCYVVRSSPPVDFAAMPGYTDAVDRFCLV